jgi:catechol 2,3-dioxygenase-like lactoylglutathione lyase family enzyme
MLEKLDGVILAVHDAEAAAKTFEALFDTKIIGTRHSHTTNADLTFLGCGSNVINLAVPAGPGPIADHIEKWGEGIVGLVFATKDLDGLIANIRSKGVDVTQSNPRGALIDPARTHGLLTIITEHVERERVGIISFLYEVTHLVRDWQQVSDFWTDIFGLDGAKFSPIKSDQYGYEGMLTLLDPPAKLDRIEVVYPHDTEKAMGRFFVKRGEGPYMFFAECDDFPALRERLKEAGARFAPEKEPEQPNSLFVHPSSTHGVLIGVSPKNLAWVWSGRPELARASN